MTVPRLIVWGIGGRLEVQNPQHAHAVNQEGLAVQYSA
jgi:hypothetical protein